MLCGTIEGQTNNPARYYCPSESSTPKEASHGEYTVAIDPDTGVEDPSNPVMRRAIKRTCQGVQWHCPGNGERVITKTGFYSTGCNAQGKGCVGEEIWYVSGGSPCLFFIIYRCNRLNYASYSILS
jgi:hypothetical protein